MRVISFSWRNPLNHSIEVIFEPWGMGYTLLSNSMITIYYGCVDVENDINVTFKKKFLTVYCGSGEKIKIIIDGQDVTSVYGFLAHL